MSPRSLERLPKYPRLTQLNDLLSKLLKYNKAERISAEFAIKHIWILLKQDTNKSIVKELFLNKFLTFVTKNK